MSAPATRLFTVDQANRMLPLVRRIVRDIVDGHQKWTRMMREYEAAATFANPGSPSDLQESLEADLRAIAGEIDRFLAELRELGVEFKGFEMGLVDFPGERDGREVCLCWKLGEPEVMFWHDATEGYAGRQPLEAVQT